MNTRHLIKVPLASLKVDPKIRKVWPDITGSIDIDSLRTKIMDNGISEPLYVWSQDNVTLLDGFRRLPIYEKMGVKTASCYPIDATDIDAAKLWRYIHNITARGHANEYVRGLLALQHKTYISRLKPWRSPKAAEQLATEMNIDSSTVAKDKNTGKGYTRAWLAALAKVSISMMGDIETIERLLDKKCLEEEMADYRPDPDDEAKSEMFKAEATKRAKQRAAKTRDQLKAGERKVYQVAKHVKAKNKTHYTGGFSQVKNPKGAPLNTIHEGDAAKVLKKYPKDIATAVITSPPFNIGMNYTMLNTDLDFKPYDKWVDGLRKVFIEASRILRVGGRLVVEMGETADLPQHTELRKARVRRPIAAMLQNLMDEPEIDLMYYGSIQISNKHGAEANPPQFFGAVEPSPKRPHINPTHTTVYIWSKGQAELLPTTDTHHDMTQDEYSLASRSLWMDINISGARTNWKNAEGKEIKHSCPWTETFATRLLKQWTYIDDLVIDPWCGSGTLPAMAARYGRQYVGIDQNPDYVLWTRHRCEKQQRAYAMHRDEQAKSA
ncbi:MAG: hypothetical protein CL946_06300 [Ectothiorhodospiraceae bacterium]|nr:hypothetical protein [Ectothiorhodospiraceae bacterium]